MRSQFVCQRCGKNQCEHCPHCYNGEVKSASGIMYSGPCLCARGPSPLAETFDAILLADAMDGAARKILK